MLVCLNDTRRHRAGSPPADNSGALGRADFVLGNYSYGGTALAASDVVDQPGWIGASGLQVPSGAAAGAQLLNQFAARLATCQWTAVIEAEILSLSPRAYLMTVDNAGEAFYIQISFSDEWEATCGDGNGFPFAFDDTNAVTTGVHKLAVTRVDNRASLSVDGAPVATDTTSCVLPVDGFPMVNFYLGGWDNSTGAAVNIRSLALYDPVADADLPALSA